MEPVNSSKRGPKVRYTEEERKEAQRQNTRKYYSTHREECIRKQTERHKMQRELARKFKEGKLIEIE
jgi:ribosomal protein S4